MLFRSAIAGGFAGPHPLLAILALIALAAGFIGLAFHFAHMLMGPAREGFTDPMPRATRVPLWGLATVLVMLGVWLPSPVRALVEQAMTVVRP